MAKNQSNLTSIFHPFVLFLLSVSHVSSPSLKSGFHVLTDHVGHGGQDRSKTKAERGFGFIWFWFVLRQEFRLTFYACCSQKTANFTSWFRYLGVGRRKTCSTLPLWNHVFCMYLFFYICVYVHRTVSADLRPEGLFRFVYVNACVQALLPL